jgi:glycosyltransferase involved in cell wall biosynthesis
MISEKSINHKFKIVVANPGTGIFILETVRAYKEQSLLNKFYTTFISNHNIPFYKYLKGTSLKKEFDRRAIHTELIPYVKSSPFKELLRTFSSKFFSEKITDVIYEWSEYSFDKWVANSLDASVDIIHCYEHCSLQTIIRAKELGIFVVYEQPSQHHSYLSPIIEEQYKNNTKLGAVTTSLLLNGKSNSRNKRRDKELELADLIICNSSFTKSTLVAANINDEKIKVVPLGFPTIEDRITTSNTKLRFIYAGTSNIRKGIHLLLDVWAEHFSNRDDIELYIVGKFDLPLEYKKNTSTNITFIDSIPRNQLLENFCDADVLLLPTLADGFGMVITEAMSRGLCVMCTESSAGPDIITHQKDGLLFKANSKESLFELMSNWSLKRNEILSMGEKAKLKALNYQWSDYRKLLVKVVMENYHAKK